MIPRSSRSAAARRVEFRLWQVRSAAVVVAATAWCATFGPVPAILAVLVAKHILVALVVAGADLEREEAPGG